MSDEGPRFRSPTKGVLALDGVVRELSAFIEADTAAHYTLVVGTDSEQTSERVHFVSVIVVHRIGRAARYFWTDAHEPPMGSLRQRMWHEASLSLALAERLSHGVGEILNGYLSDGTCQLEIHVDIGQFGPTREMIKEIVGMVRGSGYTVRIKPDSYAASSVADKHT